MSKGEIEFLTEHIENICTYKGLQQELTYHVSLEILKKICKALNFLQQENFKLQARADKYKCRNDKATEYIKHSWWLRLDQVYDISKDLKGWEVEQLLKILKGGSNE